VNEEALAHSGALAPKGIKTAFFLTKIKFCIGPMIGYSIRNM